MAGAKTARRRKASSNSARSYTSRPPLRRIQAHTVTLSARHLVNTLYFPAAIIVAPVLTFLLLSTVHEWALSSLGYALIPTFLWVASFTLALRYRHSWIRGYWKVWTGLAILVIISMAILSLFHASSGILEAESLGGHWGQYFGGSPTGLAALKIAAIVFLSPLVLFPQRSSPYYKMGLGKLLNGLAVSLGWLGRQLVILAYRLRSRLFSEREEDTRPRIIREVTTSTKRLWRANFGVPPSRRTATAEAPESIMEGEKGYPEDDKKSDKEHYGWRLPCLEMLSKGQNHAIPEATLQQMAKHIEATLADHRVEVEIDDIRTGPRIIRFGLVPGWVKKFRESGGTHSKGHNDPGMEMSRVKVQSILIREKDLALALKTPYLRLEAPVPGEAMIGLEVPNPHPRMVALRSAAESSAFRKINAKGGLPVALGEDTGGEPVIADLGDLPHLLIAGATGSGKSVCINAVVTSLLLTNRPDRLRMIMVDPKRVELTPFNGIPHLVAPVIVDTDQVLVVLRAIQNEMLRRYKQMEKMGVRNIEGYNRKVKERIPVLVLIIDELADLMMAAAYEVEQALVRLAQLGRATGIHLILATQRPSVNVVTGLLKANVPARVAFAVASQVDSRVILDSVGAEKLLGKGDMLLLTAESPKPLRVQGTFVSDWEIEKLVDYWRAQSGPPLPDIPLHERIDSNSGASDGVGGDLMKRARELAQRYHHISPSVLQRRLQIGYPMAMRLAEQLEDEGLISSSTGTVTGTRGPQESADI